MIKVAITGGVGAGKTMVSKLFKELGIPVFNSDIAAREAEHDLIIQDGFKQILGPSIFVDGKLDRGKMRSIVFIDKDKLKQVNDLVVPYVKYKFRNFCMDHGGPDGEPIVMLESAILFETGGDKTFDFVITVTADEDIRLARAMSRDNATEEDIRNKMNNQWCEADKLAKSDFIVINNGIDLLDSLDILRLQTRTIKEAIGFRILKDSVTKINIKIANNF